MRILYYTLVSLSILINLTAQENNEVQAALEIVSHLQKNLQRNSSPLDTIYLVAHPNARQASYWQFIKENSIWRDSKDDDTKTIWKNPLIEQLMQQKAEHKQLSIDVFPWGQLTITRKIRHTR